jgi:hypothetical protein
MLILGEKSYWQYQLGQPIWLFGKLKRLSCEKMSVRVFWVLLFSSFQAECLSNCASYYEEHNGEISRNPHFFLNHISKREKLV